mmetsp:Transcript_50630/g.151383  ORF Transcript_50630/g.151383 Transcript_50630/m.151383 type:complete len:215 (+) Transcript_50630:104-748(+)
MGWCFSLAQHIWRTSMPSSTGSNDECSWGMSKNTFSRATPPMLRSISRRSRSADGSSKYRSAARYSGELVSRCLRDNMARCCSLGAFRASAMSRDTARSVSSTMRKAFSHSMSLVSTSSDRDSALPAGPGEPVGEGLSGEAQSSSWRSSGMCFAGRLRTSSTRFTLALPLGLVGVCPADRTSLGSSPNRDFAGGAGPSQPRCESPTDRAPLSFS